MNQRRVVRAVFAALLLAVATGAVAQGFGSESSGARLPDGTMPDAATPGVSAPAVAAPGVSAPAVAVPEISAPAVATPAVAAPEVSAPAVATPAAAAPEVSAPAVAEPSQSSTPGPDASATVAAFVQESPAADPEGATAAAADPGGPFGSVAAGIESLRSGYEPADLILVRKAERRMYLMRANRIIAEYPIRLGLNPSGHKEREGDFRTPEGLYLLVGRNPRSDYFLSLEVSYPNDEDRARARKSGVEPGGLIMIHGQPNLPRKSPEYYENYDWTNGCIAVSNSDMVDIWLRTEPGTVIVIRP